MNRIFKKIYWSTLTFSAILLVFGLGLLFYQTIYNSSQKDTFTQWSLIASVKNFYADILESKPLRYNSQTENEGSLTSQGVLDETNRYRQQDGLKVLSYNSQLEQAAKKKLDDMFANEYFAHISETGQGPADLATATNYRYIMVGENLALGNFSDDPELVKAWMDSPGHRANIMSKSYYDIGIAVGKGIYEGKMTWLAVQEFGVPNSACAGINESQEILIKSNKEQLASWDVTIKKTYENLSHMSKSSPEYRQAAIAYNAQVDKYNDLSRRTKILVTNYNKEVEGYNQCINKFKS